MKTQNIIKQITLLLFAFLSVTIVSAQDEIVPRDTTEVNFQQPGSATIYFYRPKKFYGSQSDIRIKSDPVENIPKIKNGKYYILQTSSVGVMSFTYIFGYLIIPDPLTITIEDGETYYLKSSIELKGLFLTEVDENKAREEIAKLKEIKQKKKNRK
ncbi:MAG: hypothetical protein H8D88_00510 [Bacteroidetes bacterium]|nr:hypothetical protein [Bacteroidota bacterium]